METMGEMGMYYAAADWTFVGPDHNLLEPIAYGRPVYVSDHWQAAYPGSPVYRPTLQAELIVHVPQIRDLRLTWYPTTTDRDRPKAERKRRVDALIDGDQGRIVSPKQDLMFEHLSLSPSASA